MSAMLTMADTEHSLSYKNNNEIYQEEIIMSRIYTSADQLIGHTPLLELVHIEKEENLEAKVLAKLEYFNPAGSVKDSSA